MKIYEFFSLHLPQEIIDIIFEYSSKNYKLTYNDMITDMNFCDGFSYTYRDLTFYKKLEKISFLKHRIPKLKEANRRVKGQRYLRQLYTMQKVALRESYISLKHYYRFNSWLLNYNLNNTYILNPFTKRWVKVGGKVYFKIIDNLYTKRIF